MSDTTFVSCGSLLQLSLKSSEHNQQDIYYSISTNVTHTHTHPFNGPLSGTTRVSRYQKGKTNQDFTEARDSEWQ